MECPSLLKWNGYWYYSFSENGNHGYTKFFAKRNLNDADWIEVPTIDGFYAGRPVIGQDNRLFMYGWAPTKGLYDSVEPDWAGNLIMTEFIQKDNEARLYPVMPKEYKSEFKDKVNYNEVLTQKPIKSLSLQKTNYVTGTAISQIKKDKITRFEFDFVASEKVGRTGITFANTSNNQLGSIAFDFNFDRNQFLYFNACSNNQFNAMEYCVDFKFEANTKYHVDVITDDSVTAVYLNDTVCLIMRTASILRNNWALYAQNVGVEYTNINFYE
jgi:beta-fructofuranosidase